MSTEALKLVLDDLMAEYCMERTSFAKRVDEIFKQALAAPVQEPVAMRMPKVGDRVVCIDDESLGTVVYLTAGGSPEIKFDDGSHGTYMLREFADLFGYNTPPAQPAPVQEPVAEIISDALGCLTTQWNEEWTPNEGDKLYTTPPAAQRLTAREIELIDGMIEVQLDHAQRCDSIANRTMADKQKGWDMERVALLQKIRATPPAAQRPWVGLADERVRQLCGSVPSMKAAVREAEAELKELNA